MSSIQFKTADVIFPWEDQVRTIAFSSSDECAIDVLMSLIEDRGMEVFSVDGFSMDEMCYLSCLQGQKYQIRPQH